MSFTSQFKDFIAKGNVVDLAVGVVIGGAFGKIVDSLVNDILMPPLGIIIGGVDFKDLKCIVQAASVDAAGKSSSGGYCELWNVHSGCNYILVDCSCSLRFVVKPMNSMKKNGESGRTFRSTGSDKRSGVALRNSRPLEKVNKDYLPLIITLVFIIISAVRTGTGQHFFLPITEKDANERFDCFFNN
ncbi:MAG: large conductance mechanosensitive channel protein MscL [Bacteroidetes bacterium]|nr:large conductance mechanosensitive channel protein MscL [Bacteroidota bacterium]